jgi:hypothetical protein
MDNDATKVLQEIHAEVKGTRFMFVLVLLAVIGLSTVTMVMLQEVRLELRPPKPAAEAAAAEPAK